MLVRFTHGAGAGHGRGQNLGIDKFAAGVRRLSGFGAMRRACRSPVLTQDRGQRVLTKSADQGERRLPVLVSMRISMGPCPGMKAALRSGRAASMTRRIGEQPIDRRHAPRPKERRAASAKRPCTEQAIAKRGEPLAGDLQRQWIAIDAVDPSGRPAMQEQIARW